MEEEGPIFIEQVLRYYFFISEFEAYKKRGLLPKAYHRHIHIIELINQMIRNLGICYRSAIEHIFAKEEEKRQLEALWDTWWEDNRAEFD